MKPKANVRMLHDQILVMPINTKPKSDAGLIVVITDKTVPIQGIVLAAGEGLTWNPITIASEAEANNISDSII